MKMSRNRKAGNARTGPGPSLGRSTPAPVPYGGVAGRGWYLWLELGPFHAEFKALAPSGRAPVASELPPPASLPAQLGGSARARATARAALPPGGEIVVAQVRADGHGPVLLFGLPAGMGAFFDRDVRSDPEALSSAGRPYGPDLRRLHIPDLGAPALLFLLHVSAGSRRRDGRPGAKIVYRLLNVFGLDFEGSVPRDLVLHPWLDPEHLPAITPIYIRSNQIPPPFWPSNGYVEGVSRFHLTGPSTGRYDIVILSEGFTANELASFQQKAETIAGGLLAMEPFASEQDKLNIHIVRVASIDSGVDNCPCIGMPSRRTYFNVTGGFGGAAYPGYVGTYTPWKIFQAAAAAGPVANLDAFVVVVNCPIYGGSAFFDLGNVCFVTLPASDVTLVRLAAHELAHAMCDFAEEYISGLGSASLRPHANLGHESEVDAAQLRWNDLLQPGEWLAATGSYRYRHDYPMSMTGTGTPILPNLPDGALGAFWGCNYIDGPDNPTVPIYSAEAGKKYYRPGARCRMRRLGDAFCRVCRERMRTRIRASYTP